MKYIKKTLTGDKIYSSSNFNSDSLINVLSLAYYATNNITRKNLKNLPSLLDVIPKSNGISRSAIFVRKGLTISDQYYRNGQDIYIGLNPTSREEVEQVNLWMKQKYESCHHHFLHKEIIVNSVLSIINDTFFTSEWSKNHMFDPNDTHMDNFYLANNNIEKTLMMKKIMFLF